MARKYIRPPAADLNTEYTCNILQIQILIQYMFHISGEHLLLSGGGIQLLEVRVAGGSCDWLPETNQFPSFSLFFLAVFGEAFEKWVFDTWTPVFGTLSGLH